MPSTRTLKKSTKPTTSTEKMPIYFDGEHFYTFKWIDNKYKSRYKPEEFDADYPWARTLIIAPWYGEITTISKQTAISILKNYANKYAWTKVNPAAKEWKFYNLK